MSEWDAIVVGAGVNGLTAAARLARAGRRVLVIERGATVGGSARTASVLVDGVHHDLGATVVPFAAASPAFSALGLPLRLRHSPVALAHPLDGGRAAVLHRSLDETARRIDLAGGARYRRLVAPFVARHGDFVDVALASQLRVPTHPLLRARFAARALPSAAHVASWLGSDEIGALYAGIGAHATIPPDRPLTSGVALVLAVAAHTVGWPVVEGGTQAIADALARAVTGAGGEIAFEREVRSLADVPRAGVTMFDLTPRQLAMIAPSLSRSYGRWRYGPGACKVDYVLSGPVPWTTPACRQSATVHMGGSAAEIVAAERAVASGRVADRPYALVVQPAVADPTRRCGVLEPLWAYCHVPNGSRADASGGIERQLDRFAPGWRDLVVARRVLTAADSESTNPNLVGGDLAGGLMSARQLLLGPRPCHSPYRTAHPGVYVCSSSCPPGAGVHGMAGWHAAGLALRRNGELA